jgi:quinoprotein glucose dehydrogenase
MGEKGIFDKVIIDHIPGGRFHNGGRIAFGPDGLLYITAGETFKSGLAQDLDSLRGKILRVTSEGGIPLDNPFRGSPIYSYGHRNPQGLPGIRKRETCLSRNMGLPESFFFSPMMRSM